MTGRIVEIGGVSEEPMHLPLRVMLILGAQGPLDLGDHWLDVHDCGIILCVSVSKGVIVIFKLCKKQVVKGSGGLKRWYGVSLR